MKWIARLLGFFMAIGGAMGTGHAAPQPAVAFFYGANPPWDELQAFDLVVVDPDHVPSPAAPKLAQTRLAAYISVGEVHPTRAYAKNIPAAWIAGENRAWGSKVVNQAVPEWPKFFADTVVEPLWTAGYRAFFLDTLDSYHLYAKTPETRAAQEAGLVAVITELKRRHPEAQLIFNRGFEILDRTYTMASMIAAESLYQGYSAGAASGSSGASSGYRAVPQADRDWLMGQLKKARDDYKLDVISIDYVPPDKRDLARQTAAQIRQLGYIPWVATPDLASVGVGMVEVMPRKVFMVHSTFPDEFGLRAAEVVRDATMPLNYMGYVPEYSDVPHLPATLTPGLYAGVVVWLSARGSSADTNKLAAWLAKIKDLGIPFAVVSQTEVLTETSLGRNLGLTPDNAPPGLGGVTIVQRSKMMGYEREPHPDQSDFAPLSIKAGEPLLTLAKGNKRQVGAAIMPWGGFVTTPYSMVTLPTGEEDRWVIDPFAFFKAALKLPDIPVPDVSTESGRRMFLAHMDGDGFVSRSELPGNPYAGAVVRDRVVRKYNVPMTISVIEAEVSPQGIYPKDSKALEAIAREIFASRNVEIASHSYSHPFNWKAAESTDDVDGEGASLNIPGYKFDVQREVEGSINYINSRLAPPGKKVEVFLWTGDCRPGRDALEWTERLQVQNMNGGDTVTTNSRKTMTQVEGLGLDKSGLFQVFAPNQNENVYTGLWTGPYYGFERVIETFELTEKPRRIKPINIYFHTYITTKAAGMASLDKVFTWALKQEITPVRVSEYTRKVLDFRRMALARTATGWRVRGGGFAHTLRAPKALGAPDLDASRAVAGYTDAQNDEQYIHLVGGDADLVFAPRPDARPRLVSANAAVTGFKRGANASSWEFSGHVPLQVTLANAGACTVRAGGRALKPVSDKDGLSTYQLADHAARPLEAICGN